MTFQYSKHVDVLRYVTIIQSAIFSRSHLAIANQSLTLVAHVIAVAAGTSSLVKRKGSQLILHHVQISEILAQSTHRDEGGSQT